MEMEHQKTMKELHAIEGGLFGLLAIIRDDQNATLGHCGNLIPDTPTELGLKDKLEAVWSNEQLAHEPGSTLLNATQLRPTTYDAVSITYGSKFMDLQPCLTFLGALFPANLTPDAIGEFEISQTASQAAKGGADNPQDRLYERYRGSIALYRWLQQSIVSWSDRVSRNAWVSLFLPTLTINDLDWKLANIDRAAAASDKSNVVGTTNGAAATDILVSYIQLPIDPDAVSRAAGFVALTSWWYDFLTTGYTLKQRDQLGQESSEAPDRLRSALNVVQIAMAQQATVAGDFLIPLAYERLTGDVSNRAKDAIVTPGADDDNWWNEKAPSAMSAWLQNSLFAKNFGLYFANRRLRAAGHSLLSYQIAFATTGNPSWMSQVMGNVGSYTSDAQGNWFADVGNVHFKLPTPKELDEQRFVQTSSFAVLASIRSQLVDELSRYTAMSTSSDAQQQTLLKVATTRSLP